MKIKKSKFIQHKAFPQMLSKRFFLILTIIIVLAGIISFSHFQLTGFTIMENVKTNISNTKQIDNILDLLNISEKMLEHNPEIIKAMNSGTRLHGEKFSSEIKILKDTHPKHHDYMDLENTSKEQINVSISVEFEPDSPTINTYINNNSALKFSLQGIKTTRHLYSGNTSDIVVYANNDESFVYTYLLEDNKTVLKEWITKQTKPKEGVLEYRWKLSLDNNDTLIIKPAEDGGLDIFRKINVTMSGEDSHNELLRASRAVQIVLGIDPLNQQEQIAHLERLYYINAKGEKKYIDWDFTENTIFFQINESNYPIIIDPTINWGQWLGGPAIDYVNSLAVNGDEIYIGGHSSSNASWETISWYGPFAIGGFVIEINDSSSSPVINWGQWLGGLGITALAVNGDEIYAGGENSGGGPWDTFPWYGTFSGLREGFVIEIADGSSPTINWGQWLGGIGDDYVFALAVNGDEIYAGGYSDYQYWDETISWQGTYTDGHEGFVIEIADGSSPVINWGQWLGGSAADEVTAIAVNGDEIYVGGYAASNQSWETISWQGTHSGGDYECFVIEIADGSSPTINWGQWLGGSGFNDVRALAVNGDEIYVGGDSSSTASWETISWQGTHSGGNEGFVIEIADGSSPTINWGQWLGGSGDDVVLALAVNEDEIYAGGYSKNDSSWETISWQGAYSGGPEEGFVIKIADDGLQCSPTLNQDWGISDAQVCDGVEVTTGTGKIAILSGGTLTLINSANVTSNGLEVQTTGDRIFVFSGCELKTT